MQPTKQSGRHLGLLFLATLIAGGTGLLLEVLSVLKLNQQLFCQA